MLWGTTGTAQALGPDGSDPIPVGALRVALGALVLLVLAGLHARRLPRWGDTADTTATTTGWLATLPTPALLVTGGLSVAAYQACFFVGVARTGVAVGTVVALGIAPLATGLLGLLLGERPARRWLLATAGAVLGVALLVAGSGAGGRVDALGVVAALGAGASYAGCTISARALLLRGLSGLRVMAAFFVVGALLLSPVLVTADLRWLASASGLLMVIWLGVVATGVSYALFQHGLAGLSASTVATLSLAEPVTATVLGLVVLREEVRPLTAVGIGVVVLSLLLMAVRRRTRPVAPEPV